MRTSIILKIPDNIKEIKRKHNNIEFYNNFGDFHFEKNGNSANCVFLYRKTSLRKFNIVTDFEIINISIEKHVDNICLYVIGENKIQKFIYFIKFDKVVSI